MGRSAKHWEYTKTKKEWKILVRSALSEIPEKPYHFSVVKIHYVFPDRRRRDPDNYSGKMLLDPLVEYGVLEDDTFTNVKLELSAEIKPKVRQTIIEVVDETSKSR